jgi:hypothetical protein
MAARTGLCQETDALLQGLADGVLSADERATLEAHLAGCPACTAEAARLRENAQFLQETLQPLRLAPDWPTDFLFQLPRKDPKRRAAPAPAAAAKSTVYGETRARKRSPLLLVVGVVVAGGGAALAWAVLSPGETVQRPDRDRPPPEVKERAEKGVGPADPKKGPATQPKPGPAGGSGTGAPQKVGDLPGGPIKTAADLVAALRAVKGSAFAAVVARGWDFLAGTPAEGKAVREAASKEKDPKVRAALVLCLGADGGDDARTFAREFLADDAAEVRGAAALALARSLSFESQGKKPVDSGQPLATPVLVGPLPEDARRGDLVGRLAAEPDPGVRKVLLQILAHSAAADASIRERILEGVKGVYGDELREASIRALGEVKDAAVVEAFAEALVQPGTAASLHPVLVEGMVKADRKAASERLGDLLQKAQSPETRRLLVAACPQAGTPAAQKALVDALGSDQDAGVRTAIVRALQGFPSKEVLDAVHRAAENDADQGVRQEAERVHGVLKASLGKAEGGQENPPADNPPAPAPAPGAGDGN